MVGPSGLAKEFEFAYHIAPLNPDAGPSNGAAGHRDHRVYALLLGDETTIVKNHCGCSGPACFWMIGVGTTAQRIFNGYIVNECALSIPRNDVEMNHIAGSGIRLGCGELDEMNRVCLYDDRSRCLDFIDGCRNGDGPRFESSGGAKSVGFSCAAPADGESRGQVMPRGAGFIDSTDAKGRRRTHVEHVRYALDLNAAERWLGYDDIKLAADTGLP